MLTSGRFLLLIPTGFTSQAIRACPALLKNVACGNHVRIGRVAAFDALEYGLRRAIFPSNMSAARTCLTRVLRRYGVNVASCLKNLPLKHASKHAERDSLQRSVQSALCLHVLSRFFDRSLGALRHILDVQVLNRHPAEPLRDGSSGFELCAMARAVLNMKSLRILRMRRYRLEILAFSRLRLRLGIFLSKSSALPSFANF